MTIPRKTKHCKLCDRQVDENGMATFDYDSSPNFCGYCKVECDLCLGLICSGYCDKHITYPNIQKEHDET